MYGPEWKDKVSPPEPGSSSAQVTVDGSLSHPTPTQTLSENTTQPHPPQSEISPTRIATESSSAHDATGVPSSAQPSPAEGATGGTCATSDPSPVTDNSPVESQVDPAARFSQCKDQGNFFVKQVGLPECTYFTFALGEIMLKSVSVLDCSSIKLFSQVY